MRLRPAPQTSIITDRMANRPWAPQASDPQDTFRRYLGLRRIKFTAARRKILETVLELREHFEAEQVLYLLREHGDKVGKATVYRTLPLLVGAGILREARFDVKHTHYEHAFGKEPHDHIVCRSCGRIIEFRSDAVLDLRARIARKHGFRDLGHRFQISGLCRDCTATAKGKGRS